MLVPARPFRRGCLTSLPMLHIIRQSVLIACFLLCFSCGGRLAEEGEAFNDSIKFDYATLLHIYEIDGGHLVVIDNPWQQGAELHRYVLIDKSEGEMDEAQLPTGTVVRTPLERATVFTSVHLSMLQDLQALDRVAGVCDFEYVRLRSVRDSVLSGAIRDMGSAMNPNTELIASSGTDGLLVSPFENSGYGAIDRMGIPLIECADYMEVSPLARAEWLRFFGLLFGREAEADSIFRGVAERYNNLKDMARTASEHPRLMCDALNGAAWYVPGGASTMGQIYQDAGAAYIFADRRSAGSVRLALEEVLTSAQDADVWFLKYGASADYTYSSLASERSEYKRFKPYKTRRIFGCNTLRVPFYDIEPFHPDILLADVISILHPSLLPDHELTFFTPLRE